MTYDVALVQDLLRGQVRSGKRLDELDRSMWEMAGPTVQEELRRIRNEYTDALDRQHAEHVADLVAHGVPVCTCRQLPHSPDCEVAPFFTGGLTLDSEADLDIHEGPFIIVCPRGCRFGQYEHAVGYEYETVSGSTENTEIPMVCPKCGYSDKQSLPSIVGFDPNKALEETPFKIICPSCEEETTRSDGGVDIWLEREILKGVDEAVVGGITYYRGQIVTEFTELSIECFSCGHQSGETPE